MLIVGKPNFGADLNPVCLLLDLTDFQKRGSNYNSPLVLFLLSSKKSEEPTGRWKDGEASFHEAACTVYVVAWLSHNILTCKSYTNITKI